MIRPPGFRGAAFTSAQHGDLRNDHKARGAIAARLNIPDAWATVNQVHGAVVVEAWEPGSQGKADSMYTGRSGLPVAVFTADCLAVVLEADRGVGIAHAGWRGVVAGVVENLRAAMETAGWTPLRCAVGPGIGPCCFEVGPEVAARFPANTATTTWGTVSVDLAAAVAARLDGMDLWQAEACTRCADEYFSHRRDATSARMAGIVWLP
ncbi:MAG: polyphenol oxidase family protein [Acidimicrobiia bacterium]|nr:polyphenol oxidase family protein [Acidimicrobiia bacterium]MDH3396408.1 polyphenol oxidase family protein [Acidimicrobiia bacterium]